MRALLLKLSLVLSLSGLALSAASCADDAAAPTSDAFNAGDQAADDSKFDTGWQSSLDAAEVELDIEGDVQASNGFWDAESPLRVGQFALTYLRKHDEVFIQSLAEDYAHGADSVEWQVGGTWKKATEDGVREARPTHFRLKAVSAIVMHPGSRTALATRTYAPVVPLSPDSLFADAGESCGEPEGGIDVSQGTYWYLWNPIAGSCQARTQMLSVKVARVLPAGRTTYPEYDRLLADGKIDAVVFFGQVGHETLDRSDYAFELISDFEYSLTRAGFRKQASAPHGLRYQRVRNNVTAVIDIYTPFDFSGLTDYAHFSTFDEAVRSHEIVVWNGHSVLGASDFWARDSIYDTDSAHRYQIFLYNGCLGYEYYVSPILAGKGGWENVDVVSNTLETPFAIMVEESATALGMIVGAAERTKNTSWKRILGAMNTISGEEGFYGASGVRTNAFRPSR